MIRPIVWMSILFVALAFCYFRSDNFKISQLQSWLANVRIDDETCFAPNAMIISGGARHPLSEMRKNTAVTNRMLKWTYVPYRESLSSGILGWVAWTSEGELDYRLKLERDSPFRYRIIEISEITLNDPIFRKAFLGEGN